MSVYFQASLPRVWAAIGQTPVVRVSPQRDQVHFYDALEGRQGRAIAMTAPQETSTLTAHVLMMLLRLFPTQPILLVLDRAPWHFGADIEHRLADNDRLLARS